MAASSDVVQKLDLLIEMVRDMRSEQVRHGERLDRLEGGQKRLEDAQGRLEEAQARFEDRLTGLGNDVARLARGQEELQKAVYRLDGRQEVTLQWL